MERDWRMRLVLHLGARGPLADATIWSPAVSSHVGDPEGDELQTGDPTFDANVVLRTSRPLEILAVLDGPTRVVLSGGERAWWLKNGVWRTRFVEKDLGLTDLEKAIREGLARATLGEERGVEEGLRALVLEDPMPSVRRTVLQEWIRLGSPPRPLLDELAKGDDALAVVAEGLGVDGLDALLRFLGGEPTRRAAALALSRVLATMEEPPAEGVAATEAAPLGELSQPALKHQVAEALGRIGSVVALPPLQALYGSTGFVDAAARQAVAAIQERLSQVGRGAGSLSLAPASGGEVALADAPNPEGA